MRGRKNRTQIIKLTLILQADYDDEETGDVHMGEEEAVDQLLDDQEDLTDQVRSPQLFGPR